MTVWQPFSHANVDVGNLTANFSSPEIKTPWYHGGLDIHSATLTIYALLLIRPDHMLFTLCHGSLSASCVSDTDWETRPHPEEKMGWGFHICKSAAKNTLPFVRQNWSADTRKHSDKFGWKVPWFYSPKFPAYFVSESESQKEIHKVDVFTHTNTVWWRSNYSMTVILLPAWIINTSFILFPSIKAVDGKPISGRRICFLSPYYCFQIGCNKLPGTRTGSRLCMSGTVRQSLGLLLQ